MLYLDLDELDVVFRGRWAGRSIGRRWRGSAAPITSARRTSRWPTPCAPWSPRALGRRPAGPIRLLTHPRYAGYVFNPLSLFYCFDAAGERIDAVLADVTNTPWGERHQYVLARATDLAAADTVARHAKAFHVSPFLPMALDYDWRIGRPGATLAVRIAARAQAAAPSAAPVFTATLALRRRPIDGRTLAGVLVRFPLQTAQVVAGIYWQALGLWWRGAAFHPHPPSQAAPGGGR